MCLYSRKDIEDEWIVLKNSYDPNIIDGFPLSKREPTPEEREAVLKAAEKTTPPSSPHSTAVDLGTYFSSI